MEFLKDLNIQQQFIVSMGCQAQKIVNFKTDNWHKAEIKLKT